MSQNPSPAIEEGSIYDLSIPGRRASTVPTPDAGVPTAADVLPGGMLRSESPHLPEVSELDLVRHFTNLSRKNWSIEVGAYPLGSCTMKYNPKIHEQTAALPGFSRLHPWQPAEQAQGALALIWEMEQLLVEITGMARASFQPAAGAAGELTGLLVVRAYHKAQGGTPRDTVLIPDSAHGTNPATVRLAGYKVKQIPTDSRGLVDIETVRNAMDDNVAGLMLTNPNTLGLFEREIEEIAKAVHSKGGLLYYDGANLNAIVGVVRPGDMGFDVVHINMHKTFTTPHGGGGPGSGPVAVSSRLAPFLPSPIPGLDSETGRYFWEDLPQSVGRVHGFYGNFGMVVRAYTYLISLGADGLHNLSERAVLNANYLRTRLEGTYQTAHPGLCMHEFVLTARKFRKDYGIRAMDIAKRLIDKGFHPPTVYFPLVVEEAMMVEPTETESKQTLDALADAFLEIAAEAASDPDVLHEAPVRSPVGRLDEARAVRQLQTRWKPAEQQS